MEHYIKYAGRNVLIGADQFLYYANFYQLYDAWINHQLDQVNGAYEPLRFIAPNSGYTFRFPFPDESTIPLGEYSPKDAARGLLIDIDPDGIFSENDFKDIPVTITSKTQPHLKSLIQCDNPNRYADSIQVEIIGQQLVSRGTDFFQLCPVLRCPYTGTHYSIKEKYRLEALIRQVLKIVPPPDSDDKGFAFGMKIWDEVGKGRGFDFENKEEN